MRRLVIGCALALSVIGPGCGGSDNGSDEGGAGDDLSQPASPPDLLSAIDSSRETDLTAADLTTPILLDGAVVDSAGATPDDLANQQPSLDSGADLTNNSPRDLSTPNDLTHPPDLVILRDLATLPDLAPPANCRDSLRDGAETDVDCGGGTCPACGSGKHCLAAGDCDSGLCTNNTCIGSCSNNVKDIFETDVDCGGANSCARCRLGKVCKVAADCASAICLSGTCRASSCKQILVDNPQAPSGSYAISPDKLSSFSVYCDMTTDGGGWNVVSIDGDLVSAVCRHRLRSDAPVCGLAATLTTDWQLAGAQQNLIPFTEILLLAYDSDPAVPIAATRLKVPASTTIGTGIKTVTPSAINNTPLSCDPLVSILSARSALSVDINGYTVWGEPGGMLACAASTGGVYRNLGLNVLTTPNNLHDQPGWDDNNNNCGCANLFTPANVGSYHGYFGLR